MKVLLILSDGMRPDAIANHSVVHYLQENGTYCMNAQTVMPSVTLPCHMSLFHSVDPSRHGITTNTYIPQVRPILGLFDVLHAMNKKTALFYDWEPLRDIGRPDSLSRSYFFSGHDYGWDIACHRTTEAAKDSLRNEEIDFAFLYFCYPDETAHAKGWMSEEYLHSLDVCCDIVGEMIEEFGDEYAIIYTADHGGHGRSHGTDLPEDMTIPIFLYGTPFEKGKKLDNLRILDIAPTIASLLGADIPGEWEGHIIQ